MGKGMGKGGVRERKGGRERGADSFSLPDVGCEPFLRRFGEDAQGRISSPKSLPSDTKLLLTKNYSERIIFEKLRISRAISGKRLSFPEISRVQIALKITKNSSRGIIFVIILCQRVDGRIAR